MRIVFAGTPEFSVPALRALHAAGHSIVAVYTQPDRPAGRGRKLTPSAVKTAALALGLPVEQPANFRDPATRERLATYQPELMVVVAYGLILPQSVLDIPVHGCLNIHASLLPRWRGAAPIQRAIAAGDHETGIDIMQMDAGLDTGAVLLERRIPIHADDTGGSLHDRLSELGAAAIVEAVQLLTQDELQPRPQSTEHITYAHKLQKEDAVIDWQRPAGEIERMIRAFNPWPVACTQIGGEVLRIWSAQSISTNNRKLPGTIVAVDRDAIDVATGDGVLRISELQMPGKRRMSVREFMNGSGADVLQVGVLLGVQEGSN